MAGWGGSPIYICKIPYVPVILKARYCDKNQARRGAGPTGILGEIPNTSTPIEYNPDFSIASFLTFGTGTAVRYQYSPGKEGPFATGPGRSVPSPTIGRYLHGLQSRIRPFDPEPESLHGQAVPGSGS